MSKISYPQLVRNIADALRIATGTTESIAVGDLTSRVTKAIGEGNGKNLDYKSIVYNKDNTITLVDSENVVHTIVCNYEYNKLVSIAYDGEKIKLDYSGDNLTRIDKKRINLQRVPGVDAGGVIYKSITYNEDNTITLVDTDGIVYEVDCTFENGKITSIARDNVDIKLTYDGDKLVAIDDSEVNFDFALANNRFIYKSITYNEDNTITLIDQNDIAHTLVCVYDEGKLISLSLDGQELDFSYNEDGTLNIEGSELNFENVPSYNEQPSEDGEQAIVYKSITYNYDDTISFLDDKDVEHIMTYNSEDGKITSITINNEEIQLSYNGEDLTDVAGTKMNLNSENKSEKILFDYSSETTVSGGMAYTVKDGYTLISHYSGYTGGWINFNTNSSSYSTSISFIGSKLPAIPKEHDVIFTFTVSNFTSPYDLPWYIVVGNGYYDASCKITGNGVYSMVLPSAPIDTAFGVQIYFRDSSPSKNSYFNLTEFYYYYYPADSSLITVKSKEYQNGLIVGLASKGKVIQNTTFCESNVTSVTLPVNDITVITAKNNSNAGIETSVVIESEE